MSFLNSGQYHYLIRLIKDALICGYESSTHDFKHYGLLNQKADSDRIHRLQFQNPIMRYRGMISEANAPEIAQALQHFIFDDFKNLLSSSPVGRYLFYLIKGGKSLPGKSEQFLSALPGFLYPTVCMSIDCENSLIIGKTTTQLLKKMRSLKGRLLCTTNKCRVGWDKWRKAIGDAIDLVFEYSSPTNDPAADLVIVLQGILALSEYLQRKAEYIPLGYHLVPIASHYKSPSELARLCLLPDEIGNMDDYAGSFTNNPKELRNEAPILLWDLPFKFESVAEKLTGSGIFAKGSVNDYKHISVLQDQPGTDAALPLDSDGKLNEHYFILLKDLGEYLKKDIEYMFENQN